MYRLVFFAAGALAVAGCSGDDGLARMDGGGLDSGRCTEFSDMCGSRCVDLGSDPMNCGLCGNACPAGGFCSMGECTRTCSPPLTACDASCVDIATDRAHCGGCGAPCGDDEECRGGACGCPDGYSNCDGVCVDIDQDEGNCGVCGRVCATDQVCNAGSCSCSAGARESACDDGTDDDCDGMIDCADEDCVGATRPCTGMCGAGVETCEGGDVWGMCVGGSGEAEICGDGIDQDCDGFDVRMPDGFEPNDTCADCFQLMPMGSGDPVDPNVFLNARFDSVDDDIDCYKLIASDEGGIAREFIRVDLTEIPSGHDYDIYLYESLDDCNMRRNALASSTNVGNADDHIAWGERFATSDSGTYYIIVDRYRGYSCTDDYRLAVNGLN
jgi:hypothetical protein